MTNVQLRKLAILMLDDPDGINEEVYNELHSLLDTAPVNEDITNMVNATDGRFYLPEDHGIVA